MAPCKSRGSVFMRKTQPKSATLVLKSGVHPPFRERG
nr:MAG TPA: hypothetical protein [Caudoviricetes sp.]DAM33498.1 MAG TPA: hypothetical protein [Caudoviricetes sp.]DAP35019.1 MAG TPA: hypothetical protein [Caudoviricetes sp.]DAS09087.1 MAG TPA: hypothetical protein [Caudoviricetes sp.]DAS72439.1 MAG TPA: hypothetical protein [Caudoviricetes sp.]